KSTNRSIYWIRCHSQEKPDATHASALFIHGAAVLRCLAAAGQSFNRFFDSRTVPLARIHVPITVPQDQGAGMFTSSRSPASRPRYLGRYTPRDCVVAGCLFCLPYALMAALLFTNT